MCPGASRYTGCPALGWTKATSAQWEWGFINTIYTQKWNWKLCPLVSLADKLLKQLGLDLDSNCLDNGMVFLQENNWKVDFENKIDDK